MHHSFLIHLSANGHRGCFHVLNYYKHCCDKYWGTCVSFKSGFIGVYAQHTQTLNVFHCIKKKKRKSKTFKILKIVHMISKNYFWKTQLDRLTFCFVFSLMFSFHQDGFCWWTVLPIQFPVHSPWKGCRVVTI